jgi:hypothetical protein
VSSHQRVQVQSSNTEMQYKLFVNFINCKPHDVFLPRDRRIVAAIRGLLGQPENKTPLAAKCGAGTARIA